MTATPSVPRQLLNYAHVTGVLLETAAGLIDRVAANRVEAAEELGFDDWLWAAAPKTE